MPTRSVRWTLQYEVLILSRLVRVKKSHVTSQYLFVSRHGVHVIVQNFQQQCCKTHSFIMYLCFRPTYEYIAQQLICLICLLTGKQRRRVT